MGRAVTRVAAILLVAVASFGFCAASAWADGGSPCPVGTVAVPDGFGSGSTCAVPPDGSGGEGGGATSSIVNYVSTPVCEAVAGVGGCEGFIQCAAGDGLYETTITYADGTQQQFLECKAEDTDRDPTPDEVAAEFKKVGLPASTIVVQPPDGETLVNLETVFSSTAEPFDAPLTILDHQVVLHITPSKFTWHHGDGTSQTTTSPGAAWTEGADAEQLIHHVYTAKATDLGVSVDTTWSATWTLDGRDMGAVPGVVVKTGGASTLDVLEARPVLTR